MSNGWSAASSFDSNYLSMYNTILTVPQLFIIVIFEQDIGEKNLLAYPELYKKPQKCEDLSSLRVIMIFIKALLYTLLIFFYIYFDLSHMILSNGTVFDDSMFTTLSGWVVLFTFTLELLFRFKTHSWLHFLLYILCIFSNVIVMVVSSRSTPELHSIVEIFFSIPHLWFSVFTVLGIIICAELIIKYLVMLFSYNSSKKKVHILSSDSMDSI